MLGVDAEAASSTRQLLDAVGDAAPGNAGAPHPTHPPARPLPARAAARRGRLACHSSPWLPPLRRQAESVRGAEPTAAALRSVRRALRPVRAASWALCRAAFSPSAHLTLACRQVLHRDVPLGLLHPGRHRNEHQRHLQRRHLRRLPNGHGHHVALRVAGAARDPSVGVLPSPGYQPRPPLRRLSRRAGDPIPRRPFRRRRWPLVHRLPHAALRSARHACALTAVSAAAVSAATVSAAATAAAAAAACARAATSALAFSHKRTRRVARPRTHASSHTGLAPDLTGSSHCLGAVVPCSAGGTRYVFVVAYFLNGLTGALAETACIIMVSNRFQVRRGPPQTRPWACGRVVEVPASVGARVLGGTRSSSERRVRLGRLLHHCRRLDRTGWAP